jgi:hypothetical protein
LLQWKTKTSAVNKHTNLVDQESIKERERERERRPWVEFTKVFCLPWSLLSAKDIHCLSMKIETQIVVKLKIPYLHDDEIFFQNKMALKSL